ncbi:uncharacterized protein Z518_08867 [Rhinocladiella mackenziei CBS 650.93]|uniref:Uncharacterized protein n=1 Tax=Rhinocladiella mackenziei CBS 650.93 TaxID=1442369 RepID=A0A0D2IAR4_9EURO|nr:uncharacterized protein Z518_08867 [Rhinocladiella mackenziei CBS 650.93]KIX02924.1 hypothetical protein Z518_08867 [Rhinocladiella mackenziei CBS 650.93]
MSDDPRIPNLPVEILKIIINSVECKSDLKNVRLASKTLAILAEPRLFHRITLVPFVHCFQSFVSFWQDNPITQHIKCLVYDAAWRYTEYLTIYPRNDKTFAILNNLSRDSLRYSSDDTPEALYLAGCVRILPALHQLFVRELVGEYSGCVRGFPEWDATIPAYFQRFLRETEIEHFGLDDLLLTENTLAETPPASESALLSFVTTNANLSEFTASGIDAEAFLDPPPGRRHSTDLQLYRPIFKHLKSLKLEFRISCHQHLEHAHKNLANILMTSTQLETLSLMLGDDVSEIYQDGYYEEHSWLSPIVRDRDGNICEKTIFPRLMNLTLGTMMCLEAELIAFIASHKGMLNRLSLEDLILVPSSNQYFPACFVRIFKEIRSYGIPSVKLSGRFNNLSHQVWEIEDERHYPSCSKETSLKYRTEQWLSGQGSDEECPVESAAVKLDASGCEIIVPNEDFFGGDGSWEINYQDDEDEDDWDINQGDADITDLYLHHILGSVHNNDILFGFDDNFEEDEDFDEEDEDFDREGYNGYVHPSLRDFF